MNNNWKRAPTNHDKKKKETMSLRINRVYLLTLCLILINGFSSPYTYPGRWGSLLLFSFQAHSSFSPCFISMFGVFHFLNNMQLVLLDILLRPVQVFFNSRSVLSNPYMSFLSSHLLSLSLSQNVYPRITVRVWLHCVR